MNETVTRVFFWVQPATVVVAAGFSLFFLAYLEWGNYQLDFGVGALVTAAIICPGVVISSVVNQVLLSRRPKPRRVSIAEAILFAVQLVVVVVLVVQAFDQWSFAAAPLALVIVGVAIATTILLVRAARSAAVATTD